MKSIALSILLAAGLSATAQVNQNVTKESTTTTVTVNNGQGKPKQITRTETSEAKQNIELEDADSKKLNKNVKPTPVQVSQSTTIKGDGIPTYYELNGERYTFVTDRDGYRISSPSVKEYGIVRKTSNGQYIFRTKTGMSTGYFDESGNFVVESYDDANDGFTKETYSKVVVPAEQK